MFPISCAFTIDSLFNNSILNIYEIFFVALILYIEKYTSYACSQGTVGRLCNTYPSMSQDSFLRTLTICLPLELFCNISLHFKSHIKDDFLLIVVVCEFAILRLFREKSSFPRTACLPSRPANVKHKMPFFSLSSIILNKKNTSLCTF